MRAASARTASTIEQRLERLLDTPHLATLVPALAPETLHLVIQHRGLEACGGLIEAATPEQLTAVLDLDLWHPPQSGGDDALDEDRFGDWLEMLHENGEPAAARILGSIDPRLVVAGLSRYIRVFDVAALLSSVDPDECPDFAPDPYTGLAQEIAGYAVRARRTDAWDAIVSILTAFAESHPGSFDAVMQGCRRLSNSAPEVDGLDDLLTEPDQALHDVSSARTDRRSEQGYATPADARAFLKMARQPRLHATDGARPPNPLAAAYFRATASARAAVDDQPHHGASSSVRAAADPEWIDAVVTLLADAGLTPARPRALLGGAVSEPSPRTLIQALMDGVRDRDETTFASRSSELAFLANVLVAGCSIQGRPFTPAEASEAALATCNLGLHYWLGLDDGVTPPEGVLIDRDLVTAFEVGWTVLHEQVTLFVAGRLIAALTDLGSTDEDVQAGLQALRRELVQQREAGTPWRARGALDVLTMLDLPVWASLQGLLSECPVVPAALTATVTRGSRRIDPAAFEFIGTRRQIRQVHAFAEGLLDLLTT